MATVVVWWWTVAVYMQICSPSQLVQVDNHFVVNFSNKLLQQLCYDCHTVNNDPVLLLQITISLIASFNLAHINHNFLSATITTTHHSLLFFLGLKPTCFTNLSHHRVLITSESGLPSYTRTCWLVGCSLTSLFSTNTAISESKGVSESVESKGQGWRVVLLPGEGRLAIY